MWRHLYRPTPVRGLVDRLTFAGQIIETGTTSYRLATPETPDQQADSRWQTH